MGEVTQHSSLDLMLGDLDCNDNTPVLQPNSNAQHHKTQTGQEYATNKLMKNPSPNRPPSGTSTTSDLQGGAGGGAVPGQQPYSPDDTLNNDFFYDDEFAVPFDCNLGEIGSDSLLDSVELNELLHFSAQHTSAHGGDDNRIWRSPRMATSKSDSCLYHADCSEDSEKEMSTSERECGTSSELSDFRNEPLFSSAPGIETDDELVFSMQANDSLTADEFTNSYGKDNAKYCYDWRANKDRYMLSFDRSPTKQSAENVLETSDTRPPAFTSWAQKSAASSWGSHNSKKDMSQSEKDSSQSDTLTPGAISNKSSSPDTFTLGASTKSGSLGNNSPMTTWRNIKTVDSDSSLTTWKTVKDQSGAGNARCKSLPAFSTQEPAQVDVVSLSAENQPKEFSAPLLEMFQRERSLSGGKEEGSSNEAMVSPHSLAQLMGTWSVSPISMSGEQVSVTESNVSTGDIVAGPLVSWNTVKDLTAVAKAVKPNCTELDETKLISKLKILVQQDASSQIHPDEPLTGSKMLSPSPRKNKFKDLGVQFPPSLRDCAIQTSLEESVLKGMKLKNQMVNKSMQTSPNQPNKYSSYKDLLLHKPLPCQLKDSVQMSSQGRCRMVRSAYCLKSDLPDLSFLKKASPSQSTIPRRPLSAVNAFVPNSVPKPKRSFSAGDVKKNSSPETTSEHKDTGSVKSRLQSTHITSVCSSTSSGIDPGSSESQCSACRSASDPDSCRLMYCARHSACNSSSEEDFRLAIQAGQASRGIRQPRRTNTPAASTPREKGTSVRCLACEEGKSSDHHMISSHPAYREPRYLTKGSSIKDVEYLMISPVRDSQPSCQCWTATEAHHKHNTHAKHRSCHMDEYLYVKRTPLKSCLVKRRNKSRNPVHFKHRSWSDPSDGTVLKYSQDGQIIYQLVTPGDGSRNDDKQKLETSLPIEALLDQMEAKVKRLSLTPLDNRCDTPTPTNPLPGISTPPNSPNQIPLPQCMCGTAHAVLHCSAVSPPTPQDAMPPCRTKKSVSFSEEISYHSPSPNASPRKTTVLVDPDSPDACADTGEICAREHHCDGHNTFHVLKKRPFSFPGALNSMRHGEGGALAGCEDAPSDFSVSPAPAAKLAPIIQADTEMAQKRELAYNVMQGATVISEYFSQACDIDLRAQLASSGQHTETGKLVLRHVCAPVLALVMDGLNTHIPSIFGKVQNSVWSLVLDSAQPGRSPRLLQELVADLKGLVILDSTWLKFNAFIFALLNHKALDYWLTYIQHSENLLVRHYSTDAILRRASTASPWRHLLLELSSTLQPLGQISWCLEYDFEVRLAREKQQQQLAQYLLQKHKMRMSQSQDMQVSLLGDTAGRPHQPLAPTRPMGSPIPSTRITGKFLPPCEAAKLAQQGPFHGLMGSTASDTSSISSCPPGIFHNSYLSDTSSIGSGPPTVFTSSFVSSHEDSVMSMSRHSPITVMRNNSILLPGMDTSPEEEQVSVSKRMLRPLSLPSCPEKVYKKGITEYHFNASDTPQSCQLRTSQEALQALTEHREIFNDDGVPKLKSQSHIEFKIPGSRPACRSDSEPLGLASLGISPANPSQDSQQSSLVVRGRSALRRGWSTFGPRLISVFDKLLLSDTKNSKASEGNGPDWVDSSYSEEKSNQGLADGDKDATPVISRACSLDTAMQQAEHITPLKTTKPRCVETLCHYVACQPDQLSFEKATILTVLSETDPDWLLCSHDNKKGMVHKACVKTSVKKPSV